MSDQPILITGATGRLGQLVVTGLLNRGEAVRVLTRRPQFARALFGSQVQIAKGDFSDVASLDAAAGNTRSLLLLSPISATLTTDQIAAADAAVRAGVGRIVKISGSDWTIQPAGVSISGSAHAAVEAHLASLGTSHVSLRPNAWMQVGLQAIVTAVLKGRGVPAMPDAARVGYIDARDIAEVAVHQLLAREPASGPLVLTGDEAVTATEVASLLGRALGEPVKLIDPGPPQPTSNVDYEARAIAQFRKLIAAGRADQVTTTVRDILGRPARSVANFIAEQTFASLDPAGPHPGPIRLSDRAAASTTPPAARSSQ